MNKYANEGKVSNLDEGDENIYMVAEEFGVCRVTQHAIAAVPDSAVTVLRGRALSVRVRYPAVQACPVNPST